MVQWELRLAPEAGPPRHDRPAKIPLVVPSSGTLTMGRGQKRGGDKVDHVLLDSDGVLTELISRIHARLWQDDDGGLHLENLSMNGLKVAGQKIAKDTCAKLSLGDVVIFGWRGPGRDGTQRRCIEFMYTVCESAACSSL